MLSRKRIIARLGRRKEKKRSWKGGSIRGKEKERREGRRKEGENLSVVR